MYPIRGFVLYFILYALYFRYAVYPIRGFVFFGTATIFYEKLKAFVAADQKLKPPSARLRILVIDCTALTGLDPTALTTFGKARRYILNDCHLQLIWTGLDEKHHAQFKKFGLLEGAQAPDALHGILLKVWPPRPGAGPLYFTLHAPGECERLPA